MALLRTLLPRSHPAASGRRFSRWNLFDALAVLGLAAAAYREQAGRFRVGQYIDLGWAGDWIAQAYRSRLAGSYQFTSWDPAWNRGYPNTDGWQEVPNWLAGNVARVTHVGVPRTMVLLTLLCLLVYPVGGYLALRLLGCGRLAALLGGALLLDSPAIYAMVNDYAGVFGLAALPVAVWIVLGLFGKRAGWVGAIGVGLLIELHPFAAVAAASLIAVRLVYDRGRAWRRVLAQSAVAVAVAAPYWLPLLFNHRPKASDTGVEASLPFADGHFYFRVGLVELSLGAILLLGGALLALALRRMPHRRVSVCCLGAAALMGAALTLSYKGWLPQFFMEAQLTRSMPFVLVLLAMGLAPLGDLVQPIAARLLARVRDLPTAAPAVVATGAVLLVAAALAVDGGRWTYGYSWPVTQDAYAYGQDVATWLNAHPDVPRPAVFFGDNAVAAAASYFAFGQVEFTSDYSARGWGVANTQITGLLQQGVAFADVEPYLRGEGVQYLYVQDGSVEEHTVDAWLAHGDAVLLDSGRVGRIVGLTAPSPAAFSAPAGAVRAAPVADLAYYSDPAAAAQFPVAMRRWMSVVTAPSVHAATVSVTSPSTRDLRVDGHAGDILVVGQRWDSSWQASSDGRSLSVERVGPDLLGVDLTSDGVQTISVRHAPSPSQLAALLLLALGLLIAVAATVFDRGGRRAQSLAAHELAQHEVEHAAVAVVGDVRVAVEPGDDAEASL